MYMTNCHVHHLISTLCTAKVYVGTELHVNLDLYVCCEPSNDYTLCPCPCAPPEYVSSELTWKMLGVTPTSKKSGPPYAPWCKTQVSGAKLRSMVHNITLYRQSGTQLSVHKLKQMQRHTDRTKNITSSANVGGNNITARCSSGFFIWMRLW